MLVIISCQVDRLIANLFREHHGRHEVQGSCLREDGRERSERPFIHMAEAENRPPHLHVDDEQHGSPKERKPIGANAIAMPDDPSNRCQDLGEPQTNNDREKNRQV